MRTRLINLWESLRESYWLVPGGMLLSAIALAYGLLAIDEYFDLKRYRGFSWMMFATNEGAREVLSTIASSTMAAVTVTFSVTMVTLSLTSSQFGPRLLRNFLRDPVNQFVLGALIATFTYCLLVLRGMVINGDRIPHISVSVAILLAVFNAALFIWFIHHVTSSIRIERLTTAAGEEFINSIVNIQTPHKKLT